MLRAIYVIFILSGFVGLMYEAVWSRYLKLLLGHSSAGQILTLAIFMGGLGLGSFLVGRIIARVRRPLRAYALAEFTVGVMGCLYHPVYTWACGAYFTWATGAQMPYALQLSAKLAICLATTLPVAILLGMTFPLIAVGVMRHSTDHGAKSLSLLYFTNSLGAAAGIVVTSYFFIRLLGTHGTLLLAGSGNLLIALVMMLISRRLETSDVATSVPGRASENVATSVPGRAPETSDTPGDGSGYNKETSDGRGCNESDVPELTRSDVAVWLGIAGLTGFASFIYEVGWIRLVSLLMGSSTHSFDVMVSAFVLGLACGGLYSKRLLARPGNLALKLAIVQILMGLFALVTILSYRPAILFVNELHDVFARTDAAYAWYSATKYLLCLAILFPASFCAGITLPLITYTLINGRRTEKFTGYVYGVNTTGSILGATLAGCLLLPVLQLKWTIAGGALIDIALGVYLLWRYVPGPGYRFAGLGVLAAAALVATVYKIDPLLLNLGVYRNHVANLSRKALDVYRSANTEFYTRDGRTATIAVSKTPYQITLRTNGKSDGSTSTAEGRAAGKLGDDTTMAGLAFLPMHTRTQPYDAAIIGMGTGLTGHFLLGDPLVKRLDIIEIEKEINAMAQHFRPRNERVFTDPRVHLIVDDAKSYFYNSNRRYDVIISEPSNPWVSGVSSLFTQEFYHHARSFLNPGGVLVQWLHTYEFDDALFLSILAAMSTEFPEYLVFRMPETGDIIIVASREALSLADFGRALNDPRTVADFAGYQWPPDYLTKNTLIATQVSMAPLLEGHRPNSDFFPVVDETAERAFFKRASVLLPEVLGQEFPSLNAELEAVPKPRGGGVAPLTEEEEHQLRLAFTNIGLAAQEKAFEDLFYRRIGPLANSAEWRIHPTVMAYRKMVEDPASPLTEAARLRFGLVDGYARRDRRILAIAVPKLMERMPPGDHFWDRALALGAFRLGDVELLKKITNQRWRSPEGKVGLERKLLLELEKRVIPNSP